VDFAVVRSTLASRVCSSDVFEVTRDLLSYAIVKIPNASIGKSVRYSSL